MYEGRGWDAVGYHERGYNRRSIGIAFIGNFWHRKPKTAALNVAKQLIRCGVSRVNCITSCFYLYLMPSGIIDIKCHYRSSLQKVRSLWRLYSCTSGRVPADSRLSFYGIKIPVHVILSVRILHHHRLRRHPK